jgi:hypothetical protein
VSDAREGRSELVARARSFDIKPSRHCLACNTLVYRYRGYIYPSLADALAARRARNDTRNLGGR